MTQTTPTTPDKSAPEKGMPEVVKFLLGESSLDGCHYGDIPSGKKPYWWRKALREAWNTRPAQETGQQDAERAKALELVDCAIANAKVEGGSVTMQLDELECLEAALSAEKNYVGEDKEEPALTPKAAYRCPKCENFFSQVRYERDMGPPIGSTIISCDECEYEARLDDFRRYARTSSAPSSPREGVEALLLRLSHWIVMHRDLAFFGDHACGQCYPNGPLNRTGFTCEYHEAKEIITNGAARLYASQTSAPDAGVDKDRTRMDWLCKQHVEVRTPLRYGSAANFHASPDLEEDESDLRNQIDSALGKVSHD